MVFIACPKCEPNKQALFYLLCVACSESRPTKYALDAGNSAPAETTVKENSLAGENLLNPRQ